MRVVWSKKTYSKKNVLQKTTTQDITNFVSRLTWSGASTQASRSVTITIANPVYDKNINVPRIAPGDTIKVFAGKEKKPRFIGRASNRQLTSEVGTIDIIAYDGIHNMLQSTMTNKFKNKTPEYITKAILKDCGISAGKINATKKKIKRFYPSEMSPYDIIVAAYRKVKAKTGKQYFFRMNGEKFEVIEKGEYVSTYLEEKVNIMESNYEENSDDVVNKVTVFKNNKKVNTVKNEGSIKKYGILQKSITVDSGKGGAEAKKTLHNLSKSASITTTGIWACTAGKAVYIKDKASGLIGKFWITNDTHTFENGIHTMELDLEFKNVTESVSIQEWSEQKEKKSSSKDTTSTEKYTYSYKKKNATFTAYYPGENGEWLDSHDHKLNAAERTCAATRSIPFNTKFLVKNTGTKYDGKKYKVTDRPAVKYDMMDGRIHIDLLLKDKAECDAFGRKHGKIWIIKKVKNKNAKSNKKIEKVIKEAKKWLGKLSYSQERRQNFHNGGSADCSSFAHHCFQKVGIDIGNSTADQVLKGKEIKKSKKKRGDLVFFHTCATDHPYGASHVGICLSKKKFIHCSSSRNGIAITSFASYPKPIVMVRRWI